MSHTHTHTPCVYSIVNAYSFSCRLHTHLLCITNRNLTWEEMRILVHTMAALAAGWSRIGEETMVHVPIFGLSGCGKSSFLTILGAAIGENLVKISSRGMDSNFLFSGLADRTNVFNPRAPSQWAFQFQDRKNRPGDSVAPSDLMDGAIGESRPTVRVSSL